MGDNTMKIDQLKEYIKKSCIIDLKNVDTSSSASSDSNDRKLYIMRHGERVDFVFGTWVPHCFDESGNYSRKDLNMPVTLPSRKSGPLSYDNDTPITNIGLFQGKLAGETFKEKNISIEQVYCSPSYRCLQTCDAFLQGLGKKDEIKIKVDPSLFEWVAWYSHSFPEWMSLDEMLEAGFNIDKEYVPFMDENEVKDHKETCERYYERSAAFTKKIIDTNPTGNVLFIGHASTLDTCSRNLISKGYREQDELLQVVRNIPYCGLVELSFDGKSWKFTEPPCPPMTHSTNPRFDWKLLKTE